MSKAVPEKAEMLYLTRQDLNGHVLKSSRRRKVALFRQSHQLFYFEVSCESTGIH